MPQLEETIAGELSEAVLDSSGTFTLSLAQAREKLEKYQSAEPLCWAWRLVQLAVATQASAVLIKQVSSTRWFAAAVNPQRVFDIDRVLEKFEQWVCSPSLGPEKLLASCLLQSNAIGCTSLWVGQWQQGSAVSFQELLGREQRCLKVVVPPEKWQTALTLQWENPAPQRFAPKDFNQRLSFCPIPVVVSIPVQRLGEGYENRSQLLSSSEQDFRIKAWMPATQDAVGPGADFYFPSQEPSGMLLRPHALGNPRVVHQDIFEYPKNFTMVMPKLSHFRYIGPAASPARLTLGPLTTTYGEFQVFVSTSGENRITPVQFGVALDPIVGLWKGPGLAADFVADVPQLPTDIGGFKLIEGPELQQWFTSAAARVAGLAQEAEPHYAKLAIGFRYEVSFAEKMYLVTWVLAALAITFFLFILPMGTEGLIVSPILVLGSIVAGMTGAGLTNPFGNGAEQANPQANRELPPFFKKLGQLAQVEMSSTRPS